MVARTRHADVRGRFSELLDEVKSYGSSAEGRPAVRFKNGILPAMDDWPACRTFSALRTRIYQAKKVTMTNIIIMFMMDPVGPMVQRNLNHKCCHFAPPCRAVYCQGLKVLIQF